MSRWKSGRRQPDRRADGDNSDAAGELTRRRAAPEGLVRVLIEARLQLTGSYPDAESLLLDLSNSVRTSSRSTYECPQPSVTRECAPPFGTANGCRNSASCYFLSEISYARELLSSGSGGIGCLLRDRVACRTRRSDRTDRVGRNGARPRSRCTVTQAPTRPARLAHAQGA